MLVFALVVSALMGLYQEWLYSTYGKYPDEAMFYLHLLPLPLFGFMGKNIYHHAELFNQSSQSHSLRRTRVHLSLVVAWLPLFSHVGIPVMWAYLFCNMLTQYLCIRSVFILTTECSSLVVTLVITLRKFVSLLISIVYFQNDFTFNHCLGTACVFLGTFLFSNIHRDLIKYWTSRRHAHQE